LRSLDGPEYSRWMYVSDGEGSAIFALAQQAAPPWPHKSGYPLKTARSQFVAGFDGSAFFNVLFGNKALGKFIVFGRRNFIDQTILNVLNTKNVDYRGVVPKLEYIGGHGAQARFVVPDPYAVIETVLQIAG
jgi:hypothetical protein